jgi:excisionase family DNA binding protein
MNLTTYDFTDFKRQLQQQKPIQPEFKDRALTRAEVCLKTNLSKSTVYRLINLGNFPAPRMFGNRSPRWMESIIDLWMQSRGGK